MVYCNKCKKDVEPVYESEMWKCPDCKKFVKMKEEIKESRILESRPAKSIGISKTINLSANDLRLAELLIETGVAKDFSDLFKKSINLINSIDLSVKESNEKSETVEEIDENLKQQLLQTQIEKIKMGKVDPLSTMMLMKMMDSKDNGRITITIK